MNVITLTGRASKDIEPSYSKSGTAFAKGTIAVRRNFKNQDGEYDTDFINFRSIGKVSETLANYIKKGDQFGITGSLQNGSYEKDGRKVYYSEVIVNGFDFASKGNSNQSNTNTYNNNQNGYNGQKNSYTGVHDDPFANDGTPIDISDGDLPF